MNKNYTVLGIAIGFALTFAVIFGGISGFFWAIIFVGIFGIIGAHLDGKIDLSEFFNRLGGKG